MKLVIKTLAGLEEVLALECGELGATGIEKGTRSVSCETDWEGVYRLNWNLCTALRILIPLARFEAASENDFYDAVREISWEKYVSASGSIAVDALVQGDTFRHGHYIALKTKDAVADRFRSLSGVRPNVDLDNPDLRINVYNLEEEFTLSLDTSGHSLHRRGYRRQGEEAPLNEVLAAGMVRLCGWDCNRPFLDPMCGSGTLLIEAAFLALGMSPQKVRREPFGFERWPQFDAALWERVKMESTQSERLFDHGIYGGDIRSEAVRAARSNIRAAGLRGIISLEERSFEKNQPPPPPGIVMFNPPYDARMPLSDVTQFYSRLGDRLKSAYTGYQAWVLTGNPEAAKAIGLRTSAKRNLVNGKIPCKFLCYDMYTGSKKQAIGE